MKINSRNSGVTRNANARSSDAGGAHACNATGLLADRFGYGIVFLIGGLAASLGFALVIAIARKDKRQTV